LDYFRQRIGNTIPAHILMGEEAVGRTNEEVMKNAGLDFTVEKRRIPHPDTGELLPERYSVNFRSDTGQPLGAVGKNYTNLQPTEMFSVADGLVGAGQAEWERVGQTDNGARIFAQLALPEHITIGDNDRSNAKIYLSNAYDGSQAFRVLPTLERLFCSNQTSAVLHNMKEMGIKPSDLVIRHSSRMHDKIKHLSRALKLTNTLNQRWAEQANGLLEVHMDMDDRIKFYIDTGYLGKVDAERTKKDTTNIYGLSAQGNRKLDELLELETAPTNTTGGMSDTAWAAYNTLTEHVTHHSFQKANAVFGSEGSIKQKTAENAVFGAGDKMMTKAWGRLVDAHL